MLFLCETAILLYFWHRFKRHGLQELWMKRGSAQNISFSPLHVIASKLGELTACKVLPAIHYLTGCDTTSKVGTKRSAVNTALVDKHGKCQTLWKDLRGFGQTTCELTLEQQFTKAEAFLVKVLKPTYTVKTMDDLRDFLYHHLDTKTIEELPATSYSIREHIKRAFYGTYQFVHCLDNYTLDPAEYGYERIDDRIMPIQSYRSISDDIPLCCTCSKCATKRCSCRSLNVPCISFCKCRPNWPCGNKVASLNIVLDTA